MVGNNDSIDLLGRIWINFYKLLSNSRFPLLPLSNRGFALCKTVDLASNPRPPDNELVHVGACNNLGDSGLDL